MWVRLRNNNNNKNREDFGLQSLRNIWITLYFSRVNRNMKNLKQILLLLFICGVFGVEVKTVIVMEGESVTLDPDVTEKRILWRFGSELIAQISDGKISYEEVPDGSFRDRLQLDSETGSLTITNMRIKHSSPYKLEAIGSSGTTYKTFSVSVYESPSAITAGEVEMKSVSVKTGESLTLQTDVLQPRDELIVWRFGDKGKLIAKADLETDINSLYDTDERFRDRMELDQTGSLTIMNTRNTDSGLYIVKISSSKQTLHKRFIVTVSDPVPDSGLSSGAKAGIVVAVLLVILAAAAAVYYYLKFSKLKRQILKISKRLSKISEELNVLLPKISEQLTEIAKGLSKISEKDLSEESKVRCLEICDQLNKLLTDSEQLKKMLEIAGQLLDNSEKDLPEDSEKLKNLLEDKISERLLKTCEELKRLPDVICDHLNQPPQSEKPDQSLDDSEDLLDDSEKMAENYVVSGDSAEMSGIYKIFSKKVSVKKGETARLKTGDENLQNVEIKWNFGDEIFLIARIKEGSDPFIYDDVLDGRFKGRLELNKKTGSLSIKNINIDDTGEYGVWIKRSTNKNTLLKFVVSVSGRVQSKNPDHSQNRASESATVEMPLLSDEQQSSV